MFAELIEPVVVADAGGIAVLGVANLRSRKAHHCEVGAVDVQPCSMHVEVCWMYNSTVAAQVECLGSSLHLMVGAHDAYRAI